MPDLRIDRASVTLRSIAVLVDTGMIRPARPFSTVADARAVRRLGPVAGAVRIAARRYPGDLGLADELGELTFAELDARSDALAISWAAAGISADDVVAVLCRNHRWLLDALFAANKLGASVIPMNTGFAARQLADVATRERVTVLVHDEEFAASAAEVDRSVRRYVAWSDSGQGDLEQLVRAAPTGARPPLPVHTSRLVMLTSGTTGLPKGAPRQVTSPLVAAQFLDRIRLRVGDRAVIPAPLFHGTGMTQFLLALSLGAAAVLPRSFDPEHTLDLVQRYRATILVVVPTMLSRILDVGAEVLGRYDVSSLRILFCAGSALPPSLGNRAMDAFGPVLHNLYGSTECAVATVATPEDWHRAPGTVGRPPVGCRVQIRDGAKQLLTEPGTIGTVFMGSALTFGGYTDGGGKEVVDGLMSSGDLGHLDERGLLFIDGRADDMIVSGGENVYPAEVEELLIEHEAVAEAAVIGVPDPQFGQRLKAFVVLHPGGSATESELQAFVKANLARYKVPRDVAFVDELPRNATGKILRSVLCELPA